MLLLATMAVFTVASAQAGGTNAGSRNAAAVSSAVTDAAVTDAAVTDAAVTDAAATATDGRSYTLMGLMAEVGTALSSRCSAMASFIWPFGTYPTPESREQMLGQVFEARRCHHGCGPFADCHNRCPKPWAPIRQACSQLPEVQACRDNCAQDEAYPVEQRCNSCPSFTPAWLNERLADNEQLDHFKERCFTLEGIRMCHHICRDQEKGRWECHSKCPTAKMFGKDPKRRPPKARQEQDPKQQPPKASREQALKE